MDEFCQLGSLVSDRLDIAMLFRPSAPGRRERRTVDFVINGKSLFAATNAGQLDMCGCFSPDYFMSENVLARDVNEQIAKIFTFERPTNIAPNRVALFVCPECDDLACGAITLELSRDGDTVRWARFAYENGYDDTQTNFDTYAGIGPFEFQFGPYADIIRKASAPDPMSGVTATNIK